jgi:hypothetical protein
MSGADVDGRTLIVTWTKLVLSVLALIAAIALNYYHKSTEPGLVAAIDPWPVWTTYLGVFAIGAMLLAIGLYVSSLVKSQLVAAIIAIALSLAFILVTFLVSAAGTSGGLYPSVHYLVTVPFTHFRLNVDAVPYPPFSQDFTRGIIDTRYLVLYGSVALFCLFLTVRSLESRRWR